MDEGEIFVTSLPTLPFIKPSPVPFYYKTMINNINNFGVINFYENKDSESKKEQDREVQDITPVEQPITPKFFCVSEKFSEQNIRERLAAELAHSSTKIEYCRGLYQLQHIGCINIGQYSSDEKRAKVFNEYQSKFTLSASDFCKARMNQ